jgi:hypothetical protein
MISQEKIFIAQDYVKIYWYGVDYASKRFAQFSIYLKILVFMIYALKC